MIPMSEEDQTSVPIEGGTSSGNSKAEDISSGLDRSEPKNNNQTGDAGDKEPETGKKSRLPLSLTHWFGISGLILIISSVVSVVLNHFLITPFALGISLIGAVWYISVRRRSSSDGVIFYSHSQILYYWPIWLGAFVISDLVEIPGIAMSITIADVETMLAPPQMALFHLLVVAVVVFFTSVNIRGVWAVVFAVTLLAMGLTLSVMNWWPQVFQYLGGLSLHADQGFYRVMGVVLFLPWLLVVFVFDIRRFFHFLPTQIKMVNEIGEGEKTYDSIGVVMEKKRDNFMQHMALGFGSGDVILIPKVADREVITFPNVLRINKVLDQIQEIREKRGRNLH